MPLGGGTIVVWPQGWHLMDFRGIFEFFVHKNVGNSTCERFKKILSGAKLYRDL